MQRLPRSEEWLHYTLFNWNASRINYYANEEYISQHKMNVFFQRGTDYSPVGPINMFKEAGRDVSTGKGS
jgi:hypothetical protein